MLVLQEHSGCACRLLIAKPQKTFQPTTKETNHEPHEIHGMASTFFRVFRVFRDWRFISSRLAARRPPSNAETASASVSTGSVGRHARPLPAAGGALRGCLDRSAS